MNRKKLAREIIKLISEQVRKNQRSIFFFCLGSYLLLALSLSIDGGLTFDEETDYLGLRDQIKFAIDYLNGERINFETIHDNLEFYGILGKLPGWALWMLHKRVTGLGLSIDEAITSFRVNHLREGYFLFSRLSLIPFAIATSLITKRIADHLRIRYSWLVALSTLTFPSLLGQSFFNTKDIPFACFYTAYTLTLTYRLIKSSPSRNLPNQFFFESISILPAAALISTKFITVIPYIITEVTYLLAIQLKYSNSERKPRLTNQIGALLLVLLATLIAALAMHPASWAEPIRYTAANIEAFSRNARSHCGLLLDTCIGPEHSQWLAWKYILIWMTIKTPTVYLIGILAVILLFFTRPRKIPLEWTPIILQATLIPLLASLNNSSLYAQDRHLLFAYPALIILAFKGYSIALRRLRGKHPCLLLVLTLFCCAMSTVAAIDTVRLRPYQYLYLSEIPRLYINSSNTITDYLGYGASESLKLAFRSGELPRNNAYVKTGIQQPLDGSAEIHGIHQNRNSKKRIYYVSTVKERSPKMGTRDKEGECREASVVKRNLLFTNKALKVGSLWICE